MEKLTRPNLKTVSGSIVAIQILSGLIIFQIGTIFYMHWARAEPQYFTLNPDKTAAKPNPIIGLPRPNVSTKALLRWSTLAATSCYTINFAEYEQNLNDLRKYFTDDGYKNYFATAQDSGFLPTVLRDKLVVSAVSYGTTVIAREEEKVGKHVWWIQVPLLLTYQGAGRETRNVTKLINLLVTTVSPKESSKGIGIEQIVEGSLEKRANE